MGYRCLGFKSSKKGQHSEYLTFSAHVEITQGCPRKQASVSLTIFFYKEGVSEALIRVGVSRMEELKQDRTLECECLRSEKQISRKRGRREVRKEPKPACFTDEEHEVQGGLVLPRS